MRYKVKKLPEDVQFKVVQEYLSSTISLKELMIKYDVRSSASIYKWMRKFGVTKPSDSQIELHRAMTKEQDKTPKERALEEQVAKLKKELEYEKLRSLALDKLIEVAERDLKIEIRKKRGAKQ